MNEFEELLYLYLSYKRNYENDINNLYRDDFFKNSRSSNTVFDDNPYYNENVRPVFDVLFGIRVTDDHDRNEDIRERLLDLKDMLLSCELKNFFNRIEFNFSSSLDACKASLSSRRIALEYINSLYDSGLVSVMTKQTDLLPSKNNILVTPSISERTSSNSIDNYFEFLYKMSIRYFKTINYGELLSKRSYKKFTDFILSYKYQDIEISDNDLAKVKTYFKALGMVFTGDYIKEDCVDVLLGLKNKIRKS